MKRMACSVFFLLINYAAWSQHTLKIVVTSELSKQPLAGASVTMPALHKGAATDSSGKAVLKNIPEGSFVVEISFIGCKNHGVWVNQTGFLVECVAWLISW